MGLTLGRDFREAAREAVLEEVRSELVGQADGPVFRAIQASHEALDASGYDIESVKESLIAPTVEEREDGFAVTWGWTHPAAEFFEFGTSDHVVRGQPVLSFVWEDPPQWVRQEFEQARSEGGQFAMGWRVFFSQVEVSGVDEVRFTRTGLAVLRSEVRSP